MCVCVWEREREIEIEIERERGGKRDIVCVHGCVCVCAWEREFVCVHVWVKVRLLGSKERDRVSVCLCVYEWGIMWFFWCRQSTHVCVSLCLCFCLYLCVCLCCVCAYVEYVRMFVCAWKSVRMREWWCCPNLFYMWTGRSHKTQLGQNVCVRERLCERLNTSIYLYIYIYSYTCGLCVYVWVCARQKEDMYERVLPWRQV